MLNQNTLKASSLANTIFVCLIIAIFCSCLVLISHYNILIRSKLELQNELIDRNNSAFTYFLNNLESISEKSAIDIFDDGITSYAKEKDWGFYSVLTCKTIFKNDTIIKSALIGKKKNSNNKLALYATDYDKPLKLSGNCKFLGELKVPNGKTEQAYINSKKGNTIIISGVQSASKDKLPRIEKNISVDISRYKNLLIEGDEKQIINSFDKETVTIDYSTIASSKNITLKGNIIVYSNSAITIDATKVINDVLLVAPRVYIEDGFKGNIQIIAKQEIVVEDNVSLTYPSSIYIENDVDSISVGIGANTKIAGGIVINGSTYKGSLKRKLVIDEKATIIGNVYCFGKTQLQGKVVGSVYSDRFFLKTTVSNYENVILNASIEKDSLPNKFIGLPLFKDNLTNIKYDVIKLF